jgi:hypothetical protein
MAIQQAAAADLRVLAEMHLAEILVLVVTELQLHLPAARCFLVAVEVVAVMATVPNAHQDQEHMVAEMARARHREFPLTEKQLQLAERPIRAAAVVVAAEHMHPHNLQHRGEILLVAMVEVEL